MKVKHTRILSTPAVTDTGADVKFLSVFEKAGVTFAHVYVELITVSETIGNLAECDGAMYIAQLSDRAYNAVEWVELTYEDDTTVKMLAVVNQDPTILGDDTLKFCEDLISKEEIHGWSIEEDGTVVDSVRGYRYSVTYVNEFTAVLRNAVDDLAAARGTPDNVKHFALLNALPFFQSMYLPEMTAWAVSSRQPGWNQGTKVARLILKTAEAECGLGEKLNKH